MKVIECSRRLLDPDELGGNLSDGEKSEYIAAECGGDDTGEFSINQITYECPKCHQIKCVEHL